MTAEIFFISVSVAYFLTHLYLLTGLNNSLRLKKNQSSTLPKVSVIVAARNEAKNIVNCINSLTKIIYPGDLLEIILVNDNSTDNTFDLMTEATKGFVFFKVINSERNNNSNLKGKANAINSAIGQCSGDIILSTDADCEVSEKWVIETVRYFSDDTSMVCGFTSIKYDNSLFAKLQCIDWIYLLTLASSSAGLNMIMSCIGNNLSYSKKSYLDSGGYESINFSVTEDLALMRKMDKDKNYRILFPLDRDCLVETLPCSDVTELFSQKRRWFRGGIGINFLGYILGFELYSLSFLLLFGLFFLGIKLYLILVLIKFISELLLISGTLKKLNLKSLYKYYPLFSIYFALYGLALPFSFLFKTKISWKGRKF